MAGAAAAPPAVRPEVWCFTSEAESERAGSFRQERWCRIFLEQGARVSVFNVRGAFARTDATFDADAEFLAWRRERVRVAPLAASVRQGFGARALRRVKHLLLADLYLPNVIALVLEGRRRLARAPGRVVIMASSPPFSLALAAAVLRALRPRQVVLAVDMRDAWALHGALGGIRPLKRWIERRVLRSADAVSTVSYGLSREFHGAYGVPVDVLYNVATHYFTVPDAAPVDWAALHPAIDPARTTLVYTGSTPEGHYDLTSIVGGVRRLREQDPALADRVQCVFVGACDEVAFEAGRQGVGAPDLVLVGHQPHARAQAIQQRADGLLFLAHHGPDNRGVVSTKLFEYFALGQPVLPLSLHEGSDVDRLLRRYAHGSVNVHTADQVADALARVAREGVGGLPRVRTPGEVRALLDDYGAFAARLLAR